MQVTRRKMLMGVAGLCATSALGGISIGCRKSAPKVSSASPKNRSQRAVAPAPCDNGTDFNVILHGLFLIELGGKENPSGRPIRILSPKTDGTGISHVYRAGSWNSKLSDFSGNCDSQWPEKYSENLPPGIPTIHQKTDQIDYTQSQFSIFLPWPYEFNALRKIDANQAIHGGIDAQWFPLALALRYKVPFETAPIQGCPWMKNQNFHIFAEPECRLTCDQAILHGPDMVQKLISMFKQPTQLSLGQPQGSECKERDPDPCPPAPGVKTDEDKSYGELFPCKKELSPANIVTATSVHLPLCASILVTPS
jgi:hypothetical protein